MTMTVESKEMIEKINKNLSSNIRVFGLTPVTAGFNAKNSVDARIYEYLLPTFALTINKRTSTGAPELSEPVATPLTPETTQKMNDIISHYNGTHNFFNFTSKKDRKDPSALRFIISCTVCINVFLVAHFFPPFL